MTEQFECICGDLRKTLPASSPAEALTRFQAYSYIFRAENLPTGPRCWVEVVNGVPEELAELYRVAIETDESIRAVVAQLEQLTKEPAAAGAAVQKRKHVARRIAYWLQARPEFKGLALKELELLAVAVAIGQVQQFAVPAREMLQAVPSPSSKD